MSEQNRTATTPLQQRRLPGDSKTVEFGGRSFPIIGLVCPPDESDPDATDKDRSLGTGNDSICYIPAENGVIFAVEPDYARVAPPGTMRLSLCCRICERAYEPDGGAMWLPTWVMLRDGDLTPWSTFPHPRESGTSDWYQAEPEWVVETIDRLSRLPFTEPHGPACGFVQRDAFEPVSSGSTEVDQ